MNVDSNNIAKVVILNDKNEILVLNRADNGRFDLPGGHLHVGEDPYVGAIREVYEETKIVLLELNEIAKYKRKMLFISEKYDLPSSKIELDLEENVSFDWMNSKDFLKIDVNNATDVVVAYKAFIMDDEKFWKKFRD